MADNNSREEQLVSWVMERVKDAEDYRDLNFKERWNEYYRLWRGIWSKEDKTRESERSRLISPALQQAIEAAVSELEEATFGRGRWFDNSDDIPDPEKNDMTLFRNLLMEDMNQAGVREAMSEVFLNGAIYGSGIGKIVVEEFLDRSVESLPVNNVDGIREFGMSEDSFVAVGLVAVPPEEFIIDPAAKSINDSLYCGQVMIVPRHHITSKQQTGIYNNVDLGPCPDDEDVYSKGESKSSGLTDKVKITEYHGLVPIDFLEVELGEDEEFEDLGLDEPEESEESEESFELDESELVEAIITIANDGVLLRAVRNPYIMKDRCFIAYQHDTVPNRFWGRGIAEKGYNAQKALDAELRGRIDAMALTIHPMMAIDGVKLINKGDLGVRPGKTFLTNGDPKNAFFPFNFGQVNQNTFSQSGDLERMVQMSTGSMDSATPIGINPRNSTASGMSMMLSGAIKRSKRTLANIERTFTSPLVHKAAWRHMQFNPERYPIKDVRFVVYSTLGIMAREVEQQQFTGLLQTVPANSPAYWMLIRSIYENSSISNREQMIMIVDQILQKTLNPEPPQPTIEDQLKQQELQVKAQNEQARIKVELLRARAEMARIEKEFLESPSKEMSRQADAMLAVAKAEAEEVGVQLDQYKAITDAMTSESSTKYDQPRTQQ